MIDPAIAIVLGLGLWKGYKKGLIPALFSVAAVVTGIAAAIKLSAVTAVYLQQQTGVPPAWLPFASFLLVFIAVVWAVNMAGTLVTTAASSLQLGWANTLGGMLLYGLAYALVLSVLLFYARELHLLSTAAIEQSTLYPILAPWGPKVVAGLSALIPTLKNSFAELQAFFEYWRQQYLPVPGD